MTQRRAAVVLVLGFTVAVTVISVLMLLNVHWAVFGAAGGLVAGLTTRYVLARPRTER